RRGCECANAGAHRSAREAEHGVLALEVRELDVVTAGVELRETLDDQRLRRDGVAGNDLRTREHDRERSRLVRGDHRPAGAHGSAHAATSSSRTAPRTGQTTTQMPQPLQWR